MLPQSPFSEEMMAQLRALYNERGKIDDWIKRAERANMYTVEEIASMRKSHEDTVRKIEAIEKNFGDLHK